MRAKTIVLLALAWLVQALPALAQGPLPIFDAHIHYGRNDWAPYPAAKVLELLDAAGVARALVSSSPDDGTLMLHRAAPDRVVPILRPYREGVTSGNWFEDPQLLPYLEGRLAAGIYRGIGEVHIHDERAAASPQVRRVLEIAVARDLFFHLHSGAGPARAVLALEPRLKLLWAHAGMSEPPEVVGPILDRHAQVWTEVSFRAGSIAPGGTLDPAWRDLLLRHRDRFMIGTDTYVTSRWGSYRELIAEHRSWLSQLPRDVAEAIAWRNAARLFGAGGRGELRD